MTTLWSLYKGQWKYLYRAVDSAGNTLDFLLSAKRDVRAAARFFRRVLNASHTQTPRVINVGKNPAYPKATAALKQDQQMSKSTEMKQNSYLNNIVEQDHRFIKRLTKPGLGFQLFNAARRKIQGDEAMNMIRQRQVSGVAKGDAMAQAAFVRQLFGVMT